MTVGTDVFTSHRGIRLMPGGARQYVETGPAMNWGKWIERFREGRNFVTNGPLLTFNVNGEPMAAAIRIPAGRPYRAKLSAEIGSQVPLRRVEFIQNGNVIEGQDVPEGARSFRMEKEVAVESSCWFSARVDGPPTRGVYDDSGVVRAHSGAIYVDVGGQPTLLKEDLDLMIRWVDRLWDLLEERNNFGPGGNRQTARQIFTRAREHYQAKLVKAR